MSSLTFIKLKLSAIYLTNKIISNITLHICFTDKGDDSKCSKQLEQAEFNGNILLIVSDIYQSKCIS